MHTNLPKVSFELFPPKTNVAMQQLMDTAQQLHFAKPEYFSVTYGAGGSTQHSTQATVARLKQATAINIVPHISCINNSKTKILDMLNSYLDLGVDRLVVLRGDLPEGETASNGDFHYARDLVEFIRQVVTKPLTIEVAVYPECHPQAGNMRVDLLHFKDKITAGADRAITQYFYNVDAYCYLLDECQKLDINIPIIPGIMPIANFEQLTRFSKMCGAEIPQWICKRIAGFNNDQEAIKSFGVEVVTQLCQHLLENGAPELHFYTLNKSEATIKILQNLGITVSPKQNENC